MRFNSYVHDENPAWSDRSAVDQQLDRGMANFALSIRSVPDTDQRVAILSCQPDRSAVVWSEGLDHPMVPSLCFHWLPGKWRWPILGFEARGAITQRKSPKRGYAGHARSGHAPAGGAKDGYSEAEGSSQGLIDSRSPLRLACSEGLGVTSSSCP